MACWHTSIETLSNKNIYVKSGDRSNSYYGKFWVAKITGKDPKFTFQREFVNDRDGAEIKADGFYQVFRTCQWAKRPEDYFIRVEGGKYKFVDKSDVISAL